MAVQQKDASKNGGDLSSEELAAATAKPTNTTTPAKTGSSAGTKSGSLKEVAAITDEVKSGEGQEGQPLLSQQSNTGIQDDSDPEGDDAKLVKEAEAQSKDQKDGPKGGILRRAFVPPEGGERKVGSNSTQKPTAPTNPSSEQLPVYDPKTEMPNVQADPAHGPVEYLVPQPLTKLEDAKFNVDPALQRKLKEGA